MNDYYVVVVSGLLVTNVKNTHKQIINACFECDGTNGDKQQYLVYDGNSYAEKFLIDVSNMKRIEKTNWLNFQRCPGVSHPYITSVFTTSLYGNRKHIHTNNTY